MGKRCTTHSDVRNPKATGPKPFEFINPAPDGAKLNSCHKAQIARRSSQTNGYPFSTASDSKAS